MKVLILGDIHGRDIWKKIIEVENPDKIIFMGDYFDSFDISGVEQLNNFVDIILFKKNSDKEVVLLYGNHDHHYMRVNETYSGYQGPMQFYFENELREAIKAGFIQMAHVHDDLLFTHAGVSSKWLEKHLPNTTMDTLVQDLNDLFLYTPRVYNFAGVDPYGNSPLASPIWIRMKALYRANKNHIISDTYTQIVGHTALKNINLKYYYRNLNGKYFMVDALHVGQYLIYQCETIMTSSLSSKQVS